MRNARKAAVSSLIAPLAPLCVFLPGAIRKSFEPVASALSSHGPLGGKLVRARQ